MTVGVPSVDFGLMELGEQTQTSLLLTNTSQLEASWTIEGSQHDQQEAQVQSAQAQFQSILGQDTKLQIASGS